MKKKNRSMKVKIYIYISFILINYFFPMIYNNIHKKGKRTTKNTNLNTQKTMKNTHKNINNIQNTFCFCKEMHQLND